MGTVSQSIGRFLAAGIGRRRGRRSRLSVRLDGVGGERLEARSMLAASPAPLVALDQDTGTSPADKITSVGTLAVTSVESATVEYSTNAGKTWAASFVAKEGVNSVRVRQTVPGSTASAPTTFSFTLDTKAPGKPVVSLASDTGSSTSDRVTNIATLSFVNPATKKSSVEAGAALQYWNGQAWTSSFVAVEGSNTVSVRQVDKAGNASEETSLEFTLDKTAPVAPGVSLANDTNLPDDRITAVGTLLTATSGPHAVEANATLQYSINGGKTWSGGFAAVSGANSVLVRQVDRAGNASAATSFAFTFDKTPPAKPLLSLLADTGASKTDRITRDGTLSFANPSTKKTSLEPAAVVEYAVLQPDGTTWSAWARSFTAAEGANTVKARQLDTAGNASPESPSLSFTLLQQQPSVTGLTGPAAKTYKVGDALTFAVTFSRPVVVNPLAGATPALDITIGAATRRATYAGGSGTATISFRAVAQAGDQGAVAAVGTIALPQTGAQVASLRDLAGNDASVSFATSTFDGVVVNAVPPAVTSFTFDISKKTATVVFSRTVTGVSVGDFRIQGTVSGTTFNLPLTDSRVMAQIGQATVAGSGTTWTLTVDRLPAGSGSFALQLLATGSGIVDSVGNLLLANAATALTV